jgi:hypothetical protein
MSSETVIDGLKYVLQNVRLQSGEVWQLQSQYVTDAIAKIVALEAVISLQVQEMTELRSEINQIELDRLDGLLGRVKAIQGPTVCPVCGNARCPRSRDEKFRCTNSNAPDQVGVWRK